MVTTAAALILTASAFVLFDAWITRDALVRHREALAAVTGRAVSEPLSGGRRDEASRLLSVVEADSETVAAAIYDVDGAQVASWSRSGADADPHAFPPIDRTSTAWWDRRVIVHPIRSSDEQPLGTLYLASAPVGVGAFVFRFVSAAVLIPLALDGVLDATVEGVQEDLAERLFSRVVRALAIEPPVPSPQPQ
jgi:hypothetical protein